jgi:chaperone modulatory protein CbpM
MRVELTEVVRIEEHRELSLSELAELSRLSEAELRELQDWGVIAPVDARAIKPTFGAECLIAARAACRLREDFELDAHGTAVALALIERIRQLESQLKTLLARGQT